MTIPHPATDPVEDDTQLPTAPPPATPPPPSTRRSLVLQSYRDHKATELESEDEVKMVEEPLIDGTRPDDQGDNTLHQGEQVAERAPVAEQENTTKGTVSPEDPLPDTHPESTVAPKILSNATVDTEQEMPDGVLGTSEDEAPVQAEIFSAKLPATDVANAPEADAAVPTGENEEAIESGEQHLQEDAAVDTTDINETHLEEEAAGSSTAEAGATVQDSVIQDDASAPEATNDPVVTHLEEKVPGNSTAPEEQQNNSHNLDEDSAPESNEPPKIAVVTHDEGLPLENNANTKEKEAVAQDATTPDLPTATIVANNKTPEPPARRLHLNYQQVDSLVSDVPSLLRYLKDDKGESLEDLDLNHLPTWFQQDNSIAFWTPSEEEDGSYDTLTYAQLQQEITKCPGFISSAPTRVAIAMPSEEMAHTATAVLATMAHGNATAVPLGPRITWDAIQQLGCQVLTMSSTLLEDGCCFEKEGNSIWLALDKASESERAYAQEHLHEIRLVQPGVCGRLQWTIYLKAKGDQLCWLRVDDENVQNNQPATSTPSSDPSIPVLLLRTSGTTAQPKVVPISRTHLWYAAKTISTTLQLSPHDCCVNAMPLFHIGGIACNLLGVLVSGGSVVLQGPFHDPMGFLNHITCNGTTSGLISSGRPVATWYYGSPSMHKALALMAQAQPPEALRNNLRFARSASAHMPHELAMQLSQLLKCGVIPTYGMSEAMPICSSVPLRYDNIDEAVVDTVGYPTGSNVKIVDPETFEALPYGEIGEICVQGAGVIPRYENLDTGFTPDGWLMTGDLGVVDREGRLFIKGRSKEMIKRGGEQVWPNQVDSVIQTVPGVAITVTFGVPNLLFGEEVATAVVPVASANDHDALRHSILRVCKEQLEPNSIPQQIVVLASKDELLRGSTGKFLRSKMAAHLQLKAVDTGALRMLEGVTQQKQHQQSNEDSTGKMNNGGSSPVPASDDISVAQPRVLPSEALNGVRFLVSCFVIHSHVGLFPNLTWVKLQNYTPNMMIFFALGAFQTTCSVARPVNNQWATWVGTKIGSLHALFVISQFITLPSYVVWSCLDENGDFVCEAFDFVDIFVRWIIGTTTGLMHGLDVNYYGWFQSTFYIFLIFFPFVDNFLRRQRRVPTLACIMAVTLIITVFLYVGAGTMLPSEFFMEHMWMAQFCMVTWCWYLVACMCAAYFFKYVVTRHAKEQKEIDRKDTIDTVEEGGSSNDSVENKVNDPDSVDVESIKASTKIWGYVCDACSLLLLAAWMTIATYNDSLCLKPETIEAMRGVAEMESAEECSHRFDIDGQYRVENITYEEYVEHVHPDLDYSGRYDQVFSLAMGYWKMSAPLILLWVTSMAFGNGMTSQLFGHWIMTSLAPLGYPIYLLQYAVQRYYWLATRGLEAKHWWVEAGLYPFPVEWYETFIVLGLTMLLGAAVNRWLVPLLMPKTISWGVSVCSWISQRSACCLSLCCCGETARDSDTQGDDDTNSASSTNSTLDQIKGMVVGLTGVHVTESMELRTLGLSSLGATALLGMLRASVPAAKRLTLRQLQSCTTVGDLVNLLDERAGNS